MNTDGDVLVGVDGSPAGLHALDWAIAHARVHGLGLRLVCAYALPSFTAAAMDGGYAPLDDSTIRAGAQSVLDEAVARVGGSGIPVSATATNGDAAAVLVEMSRAAALVVVGTRGRGGFAERLLGTVSSALPAHAHCPTVVVPFRRVGDTSASVPRTWYGGDDGERADRARVPVRRIVVGVDGSPSAELALTVAVREAEVWGAELSAVAAVPTGTGAGLLAWLPAAVDQESILRDVREGLDAVVDRALVGHDLVVRRHALDGTGAALLTEFSTAVDLVVVGSRGRGGFAGLLLGSTSQSVLHHSDCPVMVVNRHIQEPEQNPGATRW